MVFETTTRLALKRGVISYKGICLGVSGGSPSKTDAIEECFG